MVEIIKIPEQYYWMRLVLIGGLHDPNEMCIGKLSCRASVFLPSSDLSLSKIYECSSRLAAGVGVIDKHKKN